MHAEQYCFLLHIKIESLISPMIILSSFVVHDKYIDASDNGDGKNIQAFSLHSVKSE